MNEQTAGRPTDRLRVFGSLRYVFRKRGMRNRATKTTEK